jgi:hypothetical protein
MRHRNRLLEAYAELKALQLRLYRINANNSWYGKMYAEVR